MSGYDSSSSLRVVSDPYDFEDNDDSDMSDETDESDDFEQPTSSLTCLHCHTRFPSYAILADHQNQVLAGKKRKLPTPTTPHTAKRNKPEAVKNAEKNNNVQLNDKNVRDGKIGAQRRKSVNTNAGTQKNANKQKASNPVEEPQPSIPCEFCEGFFYTNLEYVDHCANKHPRVYARFKKNKSVTRDAQGGQANSSNAGANISRPSESRAQGNSSNAGANTNRASESTRTECNGETRERAKEKDFVAVGMKVLVDYLKRNPGKLESLLHILNLETGNRTRLRLFRCTQCNVHFASRDEFEEHLQQGKHDDPKFHCSTCILDFSSRSMKKHLRVHDRKAGVTARDFKIQTNLRHSDSESDVEVTASVNQETLNSRDKETSGVAANERPKNKPVNEPRKSNQVESRSNQPDGNENVTVSNKKPTTIPQEKISKPRPYKKREVKRDLYLCTCGLHFTSEISHKKHIAGVKTIENHILMAKSAVICDKCKLKFSSSALKTHKNRDHSSNPTTSYVIIHCSDKELISGNAASDNNKSRSQVDKPEEVREPAPANKQNKLLIRKSTDDQWRVSLSESEKNATSSNKASGSENSSKNPAPQKESTSDTRATPADNARKRARSTENTEKSRDGPSAHTTSTEAKKRRSMSRSEAQETDRSAATHKNTDEFARKSPTRPSDKTGAKDKRAKSSEHDSARKASERCADSEKSDPNSTEIITNAKVSANNKTGDRTVPLKGDLPQEPSIYDSSLVAQWKLRLARIFPLDQQKDYPTNTKHFERSRDIPGNSIKVTTESSTDVNSDPDLILRTQNRDVTNSTNSEHSSAVTKTGIEETNARLFSMMCPTEKTNLTSRERTVQGDKENLNSAVGKLRADVLTMIAATHLGQVRRVNNVTTLNIPQSVTTGIVNRTTDVHSTAAPNSLVSNVSEGQSLTAEKNVSNVTTLNNLERVTTGIIDRTTGTDIHITAETNQNPVSEGQNVSNVTTPSLHQSVATGIINSTTETDIHTTTEPHSSENMSATGGQNVATRENVHNVTLPNVAQSSVRESFNNSTTKNYNFNSATELNVSLTDVTETENESVSSTTDKQDKTKRSTNKNNRQLYDTLMKIVKNFFSTWGSDSELKNDSSPENQFDQDSAENNAQFNPIITQVKSDAPKIEIEVAPNDELSDSGRISPKLENDTNNVEENKREEIKSESDDPTPSHELADIERISPKLENDTVDMEENKHIAVKYESDELKTEYTTPENDNLIDRKENNDTQSVSPKHEVDDDEMERDNEIKEETITPEIVKSETLKAEVKDDLSVKEEMLNNLYDGNSQNTVILVENDDDEMLEGNESGSGTLNGLPTSFTGISLKPAVVVEQADASEFGDDNLLPRNEEENTSHLQTVENADNNFVMPDTEARPTQERSEDSLTVESETVGERFVGEDPIPDQDSFDIDDTFDQIQLTEQVSRLTYNLDREEETTVLEQVSSQLEGGPLTDTAEPIQVENNETPHSTSADTGDDEMNERNERDTPTDNKKVTDIKNNVQTVTEKEMEISPNSSLQKNIELDTTLEDDSQDTLEYDPSQREQMVTFDTIVTPDATSAEDILLSDNNEEQDDDQPPGLSIYNNTNYIDVGGSAKESETLDRGDKNTFKDENIKKEPLSKLTKTMFNSLNPFDAAITIEIDSEEMDYNVADTEEKSYEHAFNEAGGNVDELVEEQDVNMCTGNGQNEDDHIDTEAHNNETNDDDDVDALNSNDSAVDVNDHRNVLTNTLNKNEDGQEDKEQAKQNVRDENAMHIRENVNTVNELEPEVDLKERTEENGNNSNRVDEIVKEPSGNRVNNVEEEINCSTSNDLTEAENDANIISETEANNLRQTCKDNLSVPCEDKRFEYRESAVKTPEVENRTLELNTENGKMDEYENDKGLGNSLSAERNLEQHNKVEDKPAMHGNAVEVIQKNNEAHASNGKASPQEDLSAELETFQPIDIETIKQEPIEHLNEQQSNPRTIDDDVICVSDSDDENGGDDIVNITDLREGDSDVECVLVETNDVICLSKSEQEVLKRNRERMRRKIF